MVPEHHLHSFLNFMSERRLCVFEIYELFIAQSIKMIVRHHFLKTKHKPGQINWLK